MRARSWPSGTSAVWRTRCATSARSATRARSPARSCAAVCRRRSRPRWSSLTRSSPPSPRPRASPAGIPPSAPSRRCGSRSTTSSGQLDRALPLAWGLLREGGVLAGISFHSLEDRRVKRFLAERAQGCICPPELPVCVCGREPQAALLARRSVVPSAGEIAATRAPPRRACAPREARRGGAGVTPPAAAAPAVRARNDGRRSPAHDRAPAGVSGRPPGASRLLRRPAALRPAGAASVSRCSAPPGAFAAIACSTA